MSGTVVAVISSTRSLKSAYRTWYHSRSCRCTSTNISSWYKRQDRIKLGIWPMPKIWDNIIILQLRSIKLICQPLKQAAWSPLSFFSPDPSQLQHFHHLFHPQSEHEHSSSTFSTRTAAAEVISVHFTPGNAKIAACYLHFCGFQLSEIRMISLVGVNQTVGHNYVVFPSISPSKLSLLRRVSLATELSCAPVCACVRRCLNVKMRNPAFTCYRSVCHIQLSVTH